MNGEQQHAETGARAASLRERIRTALAQAGQQSSEYDRSFVCTEGDRHAERGDYITRARRGRINSLRILHYSVMLDLVDGATWEEVGAGFRQSAEWAEAEYGRAWAAWQAGTPLPWPEAQVQGTTSRAEMPSPEELDAWYQRTGCPETSSNAFSGNLY